MKYRRFNLAFYFTCLLLVTACSKSFLDYTPQGAVDEATLTSKAGVNSLLIGAYASLDRQGNGTSISGGTAWATSPDNWIFGSIHAGEAHNPEVVNAANSMFNDIWKADYEGVSRANNVIKFAALAEDMTGAEKENATGQARFIRAHFYFDLKKMFNNVPWIDETTTDFRQPNDKDIWPMIEADFLYAFEHMPEKQASPGMANKWAAAAYLGKTLLYQQKYAEAMGYFEQVIAQGITSNGLRLDLNAEFEDNWRPEKELTNPEALFAIDMSANVGNGNISSGNQGAMLTFPINSPFGCCGNFNPSIDLVNSFRTNPATGLPYLDDYNQHPVKHDVGILSTQPFTPDEGTLDPRLDWTAGRRGIPFHDWGKHPGQRWIRDQLVSGPHNQKKLVYWQATADKYGDRNSWAPGSAINYTVISFADVLLMAAECAAQTGDYDKAEAYVNRVRQRAANPAGFLYQYIDDNNPMGGFSNTPAGNYFIRPYPAGSFAAGGKAFALKAVYFERKLELAMQGHRFFDLVRWGIAEQTLNNYYDYETKIVPNDINMRRFQAGKSEYYPIPQVQIDLTRVNGQPTLQQNPNY